MTWTCLCIALASIWAFVREYRVALIVGGNTNRQISALAAAGGADITPMTPRSARELLKVCARLKISAPLLKFDAELNVRTTTACAAIADRMLLGAPSNARARALSLLLTADFRAEDLAVAQRAAPFEPWPLTIRLAASEISDPLGADLADLVREDIGRALLSSWGRHDMALLYVRNTRFRPLIKSAVAGLPPKYQADFLDQVAAARQGNS